MPIYNPVGVQLMFVIGMNELRQDKGPCHLKVDRHYSAVLREPQSSPYDLSVSARGSVLPVDLGEASEYALPSGAVPLTLEPALLGAEVLHCPIRTAHQDLRAEEGRMARRRRRPCPRPLAPPASGCAPESRRPRPNTGRSPPPRAAAVPTA